MSTSVLIPLASGCEEMEAVILIDTFRRAGWKVVSAAIDDLVVECSRGVRLTADVLWSDVRADEFDLLVLPGGGPGTQRLLGYEPLLQALRDFHAAGKWIGAVCAAPLVLQKAGVLKDAQVTSHPTVGDQLEGVDYRADQAVVIDANRVTSRGPGTSFDFALAFVALRDGEDKTAELRASMCLPPKPGPANSP